MKVLFIVLTLSLAGCASVSDYGRGCRDGVSGLASSPNKSGIEKYCDSLEELKGSEKAERPHGRDRR